ncbi:hypothetical protein [Phytomonospora endophytica]|uniref:Hemerythrin-like domain-containing protein n=1 Tax=Phytomonospora endophytica TaxID=714109 RepID=A0A841G171_9ACTN|nr:hypothetical protein [Phytomonospora endophytica]MBB6039678.1 hypothetical protein [Phytomonospora endophytica]GIG65603.1 hypothetical protein Pen01_18980 [Phytomonospora endophytica]
MAATPQYGVDYLDNIQQLERYAASDTREWRFSSGEEVWRSRLRQSVYALRDAFYAHVATTEGPTGLYRELCEAAPRLERRVGKLRRDSARLASAINLLLIRSEHARPEWVRRWSAELVAEMSRHREMGTELLYQAYVQDLGGET